MVSSRCGERLADAVAEVWLSGDCRERPRRDPQASSAPCRLGCPAVSITELLSALGPTLSPAATNLRAGGMDEADAMKVTGHQTAHVFRHYDIGNVEALRERLAGPLPGHGLPAHEGGGERGRGEYAGGARGRVGQMPPPAQPLHSSRLPSTARAAKYAFPRHAPIAQLDRASDYESEGRVFESPWAHFRSSSS